MRYLAVILLVVSPVFGVWVSPTSHNPASEPHWDNCINAYDGNVETFTNESDWPPYFYSLDLLFSPAVEIDSFRITAANFYWPELSNPSIEVLLFCDGETILHFTSDIVANEWCDYPLGDDQFVSSVKIISPTTEYMLRVYEFQVNEIPEPSSLFLIGFGTILFLRKKL